MGDVGHDEEIPDSVILFAQPTPQETRKMHKRRTRKKTYSRHLNSIQTLTEWRCDV